MLFEFDLFDGCNLINKIYKLNLTKIPPYVVSIFTIYNRKPT